MKKKILTLMLAACMVTALTACGSSKEEGQSQDTTEVSGNGIISTKDYDPDDYVKLGDYEGITVNTDVYTYTDADVDAQFDKEINYYVEYMDAYDYTATDKQTVETGDTVNIDYTGTKDGVAFDGGTAQGVHLKIGSGRFIDGFEDGLIGHAVGETVNLDLTFPENYSNADLAGAAVVFEVKINSIDEGKLPEINDALIASLNLGYDTVDACRQNVEDYLKNACDEKNSDAKKSAVWNAVYATCEVSDAPQELVDDIKTRIAANAQSYADYYKVDLATFITNYMGLTEEEYEKQTAESAAESAKEKLAIAAIAKKAGISLSDDDVKAAAETEYSDYGYDSADALLSAIGQGAYYDYVLSDKVNESLIDQVTIVENDPISITETDSAAADTAEEDVEEELQEEESVSGEDAAVTDIAGTEIEAETEE